MPYEGTKNELESNKNNEFKSEIKKMIEEYALLDDKTHNHEKTKDEKKMVEEEYHHQIEKTVQRVVFELKRTENKKQILQDFCDAFYELNFQRSHSRYIEDEDNVTDPSSEAYFLRKIILLLTA